MKIDKLEFFRAEMPLKSPFKTAANDIYFVETLLVKLTSGETVGWGETTPGFMPTYSPESTSGAFLTAANFLAPLVKGRMVETGEALQEIMSCIKGNQFAKSGIDLAWWDCYARIDKKPLHQLLGGNKSEIDVGADFGVMNSYNALLKAIEEAAEQGYKRIKLKYRHGWGLEMVETVRKAFPDLTLHVDCNSAYTLADREMFKKLDDYHLAMIEQPLQSDDIIDHAALRRDIATPVCLDESIKSPDTARKAIQIGACDWINIKPGRVGGVTNAIAINLMCMGNGIPCWIGGMLESAIGGSHCLALASMPNISYPGDVFPTERFYETDLGDRPMVLTGPGRIRVPNTPGIGIIPNEEAIQKFTVEYKSV